MAKNFWMILAVLITTAVSINAQSLQELETELAGVKADLTTLEDKQVDLEKRINEFDLIGWNFGGNGGALFNAQGFSNWIQGDPINSATVVGNVNLYANNNQDKYFWNNAANLKLGFINQGFEINPDIALPDSIDNWAKNVDAIYIQSLFGYKLSDQLALSALADANTTFGDFFDPGYITAGVGVTWTPSPDFNLVVHPLTWRGTFVQSDIKKVGFGFDDLTKNMKGDFGAKLLANYKRELMKDLVFTSSLNAFLAYSDFENPEINWFNAIGYTVNKYISINLGYDLRFYKPESNGNYYSKTFGDVIPDPIPELPTGDDALDYFQQRWLLGVGITTTF